MNKRGKRIFRRCCFFSVLYYLWHVTSYNIIRSSLQLIKTGFFYFISFRFASLLSFLQKAHSLYSGNPESRGKSMVYRRFRSVAIWTRLHSCRAVSIFYLLLSLSPSLAQRARAKSSQSPRLQSSEFCVFTLSPSFSFTSKSFAGFI